MRDLAHRRKQQMEYYHKNHEQRKQKMREYHNRKMGTDPLYAEKHRQACRDSYRKNLAYYTVRNAENAKTFEQKARKKLEYAVRRGRIKRPDACDSCGIVGKIQGHHHKGYKNPLDVIWLCPKCHSLVHHNLRKRSE